MEKKFNIPYVKCDSCQNDFNLIVESTRLTLKSLYLKCTSCDHEVNIIEKTSTLYKDQKQKLKPLIDRLTKLILEAREHIPKNKTELDDAIKNPKHPFTATVITAFLILLMELSGFGIFIILTWILGNLILTPVGWFLIPLIVAIAFTHKEKLKNKRMKELGKKIKDLEEKLNNGNIEKDEFYKQRDILFNQYFS